MLKLAVVAQGDLRPDDAATKLQIYEGKFNRVKEERENIVKAREALELETGWLWCCRVHCVEAAFHLAAPSTSLYSIVQVFRH